MKISYDNEEIWTSSIQTFLESVKLENSNLKNAENWKVFQTLLWRQSYKII